MINPNFVFLGAAFSIIGALSYARDTIRGVTKPNRVSWLLWTIAPLLAFAVELRQGVGLQSVMTFAVGFAHSSSSARPSSIATACGNSVRLTSPLVSPRGWGSWCG